MRSLGRPLILLANFERGNPIAHSAALTDLFSAVQESAKKRVELFRTGTANP
jgi:hypothetical protein